MLTFLICVKHFDNCHSYSNTWSLLKNTLISVCNQSDNNFNVVVVANKVLDDFEYDPRIKNVEFIEVDWNPPAETKRWQLQKQVFENDQIRSGIRVDKGSKYIIGLNEISKQVHTDSHYVMIVDADDFIHKDICSYVNTTDKDILHVDKGFMLGLSNTYIELNSFSGICGTSNVIRLELLLSELNLDGIDKESTQEQVVKTTNPNFLKMIIGSHRFSYKHFLKLGYKGEAIPFRAAIYNCSHNEQISGRDNFVNSNTCSKQMIKDFSIPK